LKIILTNDDGYSEPGLAALEKSVNQIGQTIVIAPRNPQSCAGHRVTLKAPIPVEKIDDSKYIVDGSPADCTRLAIKQFAPDAEWLIAGINPGANLGTDLYQSGTVAAAREAAILGYNSISISQYIAPDQTVDWEVTVFHVSSVLKKILANNLSTGQYININMPHPLSFHSKPEIKWCLPDKNPHNYNFSLKSGSYIYNGSIHQRPISKGKDVDVCFNGSISATLLEV